MKGPSMKKAKFRRILLKLSGEVLRDPQTGDCLSDAVLADMASQIKAVRKMGVQVGVVIGGGNIFRGLKGQDRGFGRAHGDDMGMLATMINSLALQSALEATGVPAKALSARAIRPSPSSSRSAAPSSCSRPERSSSSAGAPATPSSPPTAPPRCEPPRSAPRCS